MKSSVWETKEEKVLGRREWVSCQESSRKKDNKSVQQLWGKGTLEALLRAVPLVRLNWKPHKRAGVGDNEQTIFQEDLLERKEEKQNSS